MFEENYSSIIKFHVTSAQNLIFDVSWNLQKSKMDFLELVLQNSVQLMVCRLRSYHAINITHIYSYNIISLHLTHVRHSPASALKTTRVWSCSPLTYPIRVCRVREVSPNTRPKETSSSSFSSSSPGGWEKGNTRTATRVRDASSGANRHSRQRVACSRGKEKGEGGKGRKDGGERTRGTSRAVIFSPMDLHDCVALNVRQCFPN